ncbi:MAG: sugar ABC transporter substrate-binding protein [Kiritimatiellae bacterium]|nr:sugar ABC transporter substrate-binding protein [Kiritimatiellia bacterium]
MTIRPGTWVGCCAAVAMAVASGCSRQEAGPAGGGGRPRVALIMKSLANEFFATMAEGARAHQQARANDYELLINGIKDERDLQRQAALVEEMVAQRVDAIVIAPADSKALVPVLKRAQDRGVVVVNIDNRLDAEVCASVGAKIPFVGPDNRAGARRVAEVVAARLRPGDKVLILEGIRTSFNGQQRRLGFEDAIRAANLQIADSQSAEWEMNIANRIAAAMLTTHPDAKAILAANDNMALGALAAVRAAGRVGEVLIAGFDNIAAVRQAIRAGEIVATADQHADQLAVFGIEHALKILRGESVPGDLETPVDLITAENVGR